jgi:hypothetical protein
MVLERIASVGFFAMRAVIFVVRWRAGTKGGALWGFVSKFPFTFLFGFLPLN